MPIRPISVTFCFTVQALDECVKRNQLNAYDRKKNLRNKSKLFLQCSSLFLRASVSIPLIKSLYGGITLQEVRFCAFVSISYKILFSGCFHTVNIIPSKCYSDGVAEKIKDKCENKTTCSLKASDKYFGNACRWPMKEDLKVKYDCVNSSAGMRIL